MTQPGLSPGRQRLFSWERLRRTALGGALACAALAAGLYWLLSGFEPAASVEPAAAVKPPTIEITLESVIEQAKKEDRPAAAPAAKPDQARAAKSLWQVQVLATSNAQGARRAMLDYKSRGFPVYVLQSSRVSTVLYRVRLGPYASQAEAGKAAGRLDALGFKHAAPASEDPAAHRILNPESLGVQAASPVKDATLVTGKDPSATTAKPAAKTHEKPPRKTSAPAVKPQAKAAPKSQAKAAPRSGPKQANKVKSQTGPAASDPVAEAIRADKDDFISRAVKANH